MTPAAYRSLDVDGLSILNREAGPSDSPAVLLLHGFPSSSRMYEPLLARLADRYRLIAPDYPGFGHSDAPDPKNFAYSFDRLAQVIERFTQALGLTRYTLFLQDYGGPVGFEKKFRISQRRDRWPKIGSRQEKVSAGAKPPTSKPANCGPLASTQGNLRFERLRGGGCSPHRTGLPANRGKFRGNRHPRGF